MDNNPPPVKKGFRERFLVPVRSRIRPTSRSSRTAAGPKSAATPQPAPTSPLPSVLPIAQSQNYATLSASERLLNEALQVLSESERTLILKYISTSSTDVVVALDQVIQVARIQQQQYQNKRWAFKLGERTFTLQEEADKVFQWLNRFKAVGDIIANVDPVHVGLPWAGIRLLLEVSLTFFS